MDNSSLMTISKLTTCDKNSFIKVANNKLKLRRAKSSNYIKNLIFEGISDLIKNSIISPKNKGQLKKFIKKVSPFQSTCLNNSILYENRVFQNSIIREKESSFRKEKNKPYITKKKMNTLDKENTKHLMLSQKNELIKKNLNQLNQVMKSMIFIPQQAKIKSKKVVDKKPQVPINQKFELYLKQKFTYLLLPSENEEVKINTNNNRINISNNSKKNNENIIRSNTDPIVKDRKSVV